MGFEDKYRMSVHAVISNEDNNILQLKATYGDKNWGLPGGAIEPGETVHEALERECLEEIGQKIKINELTGVYYHKYYNSHVVLFKCELEADAEIQLSEEHAEFKFFPVSELSSVQNRRVMDALEFNGKAISRKF